MLLITKIPFPQKKTRNLRMGLQTEIKRKEIQRKEVLDLALDMD